jgi:hypothetical protein
MVQRFTFVPLTRREIWQESMWSARLYVLIDLSDWYRQFAEGWKGDEYEAGNTQRTRAHAVKEIERV